MNLKQILQLLGDVSNEIGVNSYICGGIPRDKVIGNLSQSFNDIDITTGSNTQHLAKEFSIVLKKQIPLVVKQADDGHISLYTPQLKIDFSSNFIVPNINNILLSKGIRQATDIQKEAFSRDFTVNTLLMSLDFRKIKDITGEGIKDIKNKIIRTCLTPDLTFKFNIKRIIRVVYLSAKLNFDVDPKIIQWIKANPKFILGCEKSYLSKNIDKALEYDADKTVYLINKMELWKYIPITQKLYPFFKKHTIQENFYAT